MLSWIDNSYIDLPCYVCSLVVLHWYRVESTFRIICRKNTWMLYGRALSQGMFGIFCLPFVSHSQLRWFQTLQEQLAVSKSSFGIYYRCFPRRFMFLFLGQPWTIFVSWCCMFLWYARTYAYIAYIPAFFVSEVVWNTSCIRMFNLFII